MDGNKVGFGMTDHIIKSYDDELQRLERLISEMGGLIESQISDALEAFVQRNSEAAAAVIAADRRADRFNEEINLFVLRLLALRQPMASDLRTIVGALRIAGDLERIGDYAANVAKRTMAISSSVMLQPTSGIVRMGHLARQIVKNVLDAFSARDADAAHLAWARDSEVDEMYTSLFRELLTYMMEDPREISACTHLLFIAKNIERIGDHATNIAETVHFVVEGTPMPDTRPKGDQTSYTLITTPPDDKSKSSSVSAIARD